MSAKRKTKRARKNRDRRDRRPRPIQIVTARDGGPFDGDCSCPVCVDLASRGIPLMTLGADGELVEVARPAPPPMIEVVVRGTASTWPELSTEPRTVSVPSGCTVQDLLEFLRYRDFGLQQGFPPAGLSASIDGHACEDQRVARAGEELRVTGRRDPGWTSLASTFTPMPE
jgi:hypothetical protein